MTLDAPASRGFAPWLVWHIKHFFFRYDSHGAVVSGEASRLPASGHRYTGYLFESPRGYLCAASLDETNSAVEKGDNRHFGFCVTLSHKFAFIWTANTPNPEKYKPR
jgi:hypothetical protein